MKHRILALFTILFFVVTYLQAQLEPVTWESRVVKVDSDTYNLEFTATIDDGWHIYSQEKSVAEIAPIPTSFSFKIDSTNVQLLGETQEPKGVRTFDKTFEIDITYFEEKAIFVQKVRSNKPNGKILASVEWMVCNDTQCLPPDTAEFELILTSESAKSNVTSQGMIVESDRNGANRLNIGVKGWEKYEQETVREQNYLMTFLLGFIGGLIALLTPCVFPMIPLTVSFFTKRTENKAKGKANAFVYGFFILLIYVLLSVPFHVLDSLDPEILNNISTNFTLNIIFFLIFVAFAFSFFGYFEITLPASWSNKMDEKATSIGGVIGIFFMALTLALVSFSCTGPILGSLLGGTLSSDGGAWQLSFGMGGFGLALALPFGLFALFPNLLTSLPKSGGWLTSVKVVLGFIELALAFKFLSNAELVMHLGILKREIFIGIWIVIAIGLALYLFGFIRFPHDGPLPKIPLWRKVLGTITIIFTLYLLPGVTNTAYANRQLLSGFPPPLFYSIYNDPASHEVLGFEAYRSYEEGLAAAKASGKPILLDFTGWACVNCRKMEENVWIEPEVSSLIRDQFILISLYVDDRKELPEAEQFNFKRASGSIKKIKTVGDKWATFQTINFRNNSQPYYVILDTDGNLLNKPIGNTPDVNSYVSWLSEGLGNM